MNFFLNKKKKIHFHLFLLLRREETQTLFQFRALFIYVSFEMMADYYLIYAKYWNKTIQFTIIFFKYIEKYLDEKSKKKIERKRKENKEYFIFH